MDLLDSYIDDILVSYEEHGGVNNTDTQNLPDKQSVIEILSDIQAVMFPGFIRAEIIDAQNLRFITGERINRIAKNLTREAKKSILYHCKRTTKECNGDACQKLADRLILALIKQLPELRRLVTTDIKAALLGDPAARSMEEVILSYPGIEAILVQRIAHYLHINGLPLIPRIMTEFVHGKTGIDIHPGAEIGENFFIDHGTGVVIGETTVIGKNVKIYLGVTLGALSVSKDMADKKRHPTIQDDVTIYAGATILGGKTIIGFGSTIGGNTWITQSVPPNSTIYNKTTNK